MSKRNDHVTVNPSTLRITEEKTLQLISECEKQECLWNTQLIDYPNKQERLWAYEVIAEKLGIPNFTARHVMTKFKNLRNSYCQELKKIAADEDYTPKVLWFPHLDKYLRPHLQKIKSYTERTKLLQNTSVEPRTDVDSDDHIENKNWIIQNFIQSDASCSNHSTQFRNDSGETLITEKNIPNKRKLSEESNNDEQLIIKRKYSNVEENSNEFQKCVDPLTGISTTILEIDETSSTTTAQLTKSRGVDHYEAFGTYIASLLRSLPPKKALMLEPKIINMIVSVGVEDLTNSGYES